MSLNERETIQSDKLNETSEEIQLIKRKKQQPNIKYHKNTFQHQVKGKQILQIPIGKLSV